ncbi:hypothetical protein ABT263_30260 [Kitasatospora sp. NPDC001603]|uniref:hypothetical protein n=1 Tax=Kitasatospora sp. NPDC001603 TaxID=3154388 RepID=UPI0033179107
MTTRPVEPSPADGPAPEAPAEPAAPVAPPAAPPAEPVAPADGPAPDAPAAPPATVFADGFAPTAAVLPPNRPRRPRPVLLLTCGLLLGTLLGGAVGYAVQANRPPTPLPPIQVARPSYPAEVVDPAAVAAAAPRPPAVDGDLRKLLVTAPAGSTAWADFPDTPSWITIGELAEHTGRSAEAFRALNVAEFRRAVEVDWKKDDLKVRVSLIQYGPDHAASAKYAAAAYRLQPFADDANGGFHVDSEPSHWAESTEQYYLGTALAQRGTLVMKVEAFGTRPVNPDVVKDIAKQQWERLV